MLLLVLGGCADTSTRPAIAPEVVGSAVTVASAADKAAASGSTRADSTPYLGIVVGDRDAMGVEVLAVLPGPAAQAGLRAGDRIARVDGAALDGPALVARLAAAPVGAVLGLDVLRGDGAWHVDVILAPRAAWQGPAQWAAPAAAPVASATTWRGVLDDARALLAPTDTERLWTPLVEHLGALAAVPRGLHTPALLQRARRDPGALLSALDDLAAALAGAQRLTQHGRALLCTARESSCPAPAPQAPVLDLVALAARLAPLLEAATPATARSRDELAPELELLLAATARGEQFQAQVEAPRAIALMQAGAGLDQGQQWATLLALFDLAETTVLAGNAAAPSPAALRALVEGPIDGWVALAAGYVVLGGDGDNTYRMEGLVAVVDRGGDDRYTWSEALAPPLQFILDRAGDDRYGAPRGGPGSGWLGVALLLDEAGDDRYESALGGCGTGLFGYGVLLDGAGNDVYDCAAWALGAAFHGAGLALDAGSGADRYTSAALAQGLGGPGGIGVLADLGGDDLYHATGVVPSVYGTPTVYAGFSQGVGYGLRPHAHGGLGALLDRAGDDRYEAGEFSQGGGYFHGVGLLDDGAGDDLHYGNRYAQGFAAHQAAGLHRDRAGDDLYWSMTAAGQGAAWDESVALLVDDAGDDHYRAGTLSQGAAAHQSLGLLHDRTGDDRYDAGSDIAQGAADDNAYHWQAARPVTSLGVLVDEAGNDRYTTGLVNGGRRSRTEPRAEGRGRGLAGVAIDRP